jgi:hypothetical protein
VSDIRTGLCPDCGHEHTTGDDVLSFSPDTGWVAEFTMPLAEGEQLHDLTEVRTPDGKRQGTWREPVIGWAVTEHHAEPFDSGHWREIEPVLLDEAEHPVTMRELPRHPLQHRRPAHPHHEG